MNIFWIENTCYCPLDHGFLAKEIFEGAEVLACPKCRNKYLRRNSCSIESNIVISDGFVKSKRITSTGRNQTQEIEMTLIMTLQNEAS